MSDKNGSAIGTVLIENSRIRVTEWCFQNQGDNTGWHRHEFDYVVIPLFDGVLNLASSDGQRVAAKLAFGAPYFREAGVEHDVINGNTFECSFIEVELLE